MWQIKDAITEIRSIGLVPHVVMMDAKLFKRFELALACGSIESISKIPVAPIEAFKPGWKVLYFKGGLE